MRDPLYELLRHFTSPVVAVTSSARGRRNGMIANSVQRASLVPTVPRISVYISKINYTHELIYSSGVFGVHLLRNDQWDVIWRLGLESGRERDKLAAFEIRGGETGCPLLADARATFECRVSNAMDAGAATFFLGDVVSISESDPAPIMTSEYFRANMAPDRKIMYESKLDEAQRVLEPLARTVNPAPWPGPIAEP